MPALQKARGMAKFARWQGIKRSIICNPDCILYYTFEEGEGTKIKNLGGVGSTDVGYDPAKLNGTLQGTTATWYISGGSGARFPGKTYLDLGIDEDNYIGLDPGNLKELNFGTNSFSIECWVRMPSVISGTIGAIIAEGTPLSAANDHAYYIGISGPPHYLYFSVSDGTNARYLQVNSPSVVIEWQPNQWYHLVAVRKTTDDSERLILYVNGKIETGGDTTWAVSPLSIQQKPLYRRINNVDGWYHFNSFIDEIAIYKRALTETEIIAHYRGGRP